MSHRQPRPSIPPPLFLRPTSKNSQLSRSPRRSCRCPLIPRNRTRFHRKDPRRDVDFSPNFPRSIDGQGVLLISNVTFPVPLLFYIHRVWETHSGLKHSDERWFRCTREQREETGRNGRRSISLSLSAAPLVAPSHSPGWCMRVAERRGC